MRILITGGAGFVGSHLAEKLLEEGRQVSIIDDLSTGSFKNIEHLKQLYGLERESGAAARGGRLTVAGSGSRFRYSIDSVMNVPLLALTWEMGPR